MTLRFFENGDPDDVHGTYYQSMINISYKDLVSIFGEPHSMGDGYKVDAEWILQFNTPEGPVVATIYNYKDGKNYLGRSGMATSRIRNWHIGSKEPIVTTLIKQAILITPRSK